MYLRRKPQGLKTCRLPPCGLPGHRRHSRLIRPTTHQGRAGFTLFEMIATGVLLGVLMVVTVPALRWIALERRADQRHRQALAEASNIMERLAAEPWERITNEDLQNSQLAAPIRRQLPEAQLRVALHESADAPTAKQIALELSWNDHTGKQVAPVRLSVWIYRQNEAKP